MGAEERTEMGGLFVAFQYNGTVAAGDQVEIAANRKVQRLTSIGSMKRIGSVETVRASLTECVVRMRGRRNVPDAVAGADGLVIGEFVYGPDNKVHQYTPAAPARHDGTATGPKTVVLDTSDKVKVKLVNGSSQTVTLTAGVDVTFAAIAAELNTGLTGITAEVDLAGHLNLVADQIFEGIEIEAVTHDAYTLLGWTAGIYAPISPSHDPRAVDGMILVGGDQDDAIEVLEY